MKLISTDVFYFGICLEGFFFKLYSGIFAVHLQHHASNKGTDNAKQNIIFYALFVLYVLSVPVIALDIANIKDIIHVDGDNIGMVERLNGIIQPVVFGCCDFIAQSVLIHRCWIVWGCNTRIVIIPSILTLAFLATWMATNGAEFIGDGIVWGDTLLLTSLTISVSVNALVTGLITFRIFTVFRAMGKGITTSDEKYLGITGERKLRSIMFVIIESGVALFAIQLARLVISAIARLSTTADASTFSLIIGIHEMLNGITITMVRVLTRLFFHDESSLVETASGLQFASAASGENPIPGAGSISQDEDVRVGPDGPNAIL